MEWFVGGLVVVVLGLAAVAGSGRFGSMPPPVHDSPVIELPDGDLTVIAGGHHLHMEQPADVAAAIGDFLLR